MRRLHLPGFTQETAVDTVSLMQGQIILNSPAEFFLSPTGLIGVLNEGQPGGPSPAHLDSLETGPALRECANIRPELAVAFMNW